MFYLGKASRRNLKGVHPQLIFIIEQALADSPIDFGIPSTGGVRTDKQQQDLYFKGASKLDGYNQRSKHQLSKGLGTSYGEAFDFFAYVNGEASYRHQHMYTAGAAIMTTAERLRKEGKVTVRLRWGASFDSDSLLGWDVGHIEIVSNYDE